MLPLPDPLFFIAPSVMLVLADEEDRAFLTQLYLGYRALMYRVALEFFPGEYSEAEDVFSTALEKLCSHAKQIRAVPEKSRASYIARLTANTCRDRLRQMKRRGPSLSLDDDQALDLPDSRDGYRSLFEYGSAGEVLASWEELNDRDRELLQMRYVEEKTVAEMAAVLQVTEASVRSAIFRAKHHLETILERRKTDA